MQEFKYYKSGEITVFLSLVFLAMIAFVAVIIQSSREVYIEHKIESISDIAIRSVFSEYDVYLYENYGLLYVDTTYKGAETGGEEYLLEHLSSYINANLVDDRLGIEICSLEANNICYADSNNYDSIRYQIRTFMTLNQEMSEYATDEDILDKYIDLKMPSDFYEKISMDDESMLLTYEEKLYEVVKAIESDMVENQSSKFSFSNQIESAVLNIQFSGANGRLYECERYYSLTW